MSSYSAQEIQEMIATGNVTALNAIKGIGTKTAQRIIIDLKDKIMKVAGTNNTGSSALALNNPIKEEAVSALVMLGFAAAASQKAVEQILKNDATLRVEQLIKMALKML
jgi:holliday junction DNA helicase RuvA